MPSWRILAALGVPCALGLAWAWNVWKEPTDASDQFTRAITKVGFYPVTPPNTLRAPGSIYFVSGDGKTTTALCEAASERVITVMRRSFTQETVSDELRNASFSISARILEHSSAAERKILQRVSYAFNEVQVLEVSLENLATIAAELQSRPACASEIGRYLRAGEYVCQGQRVLMASAEYTVKTDDEAAAATALSTQILENTIKAAIEPRAEMKGLYKVGGERLYYGMLLAPRCMGLPGMWQPQPPVSWYARIMNLLGR